MALKFKKLNIPDQVLTVLKAIESARYRGYIVGECVSELLRGGTPMDYDIITNADFDELEYIFKDSRVVSSNKDMSCLMVSVLGMVIQVSTYRSGVKDGKAICTDNYLYDLLCRDFSVNAIAYHPRKGYKDPFDGAECIKDGVITLKAIGEYPIKLWKENDLDENELTLKMEPPSSLVTNPANMLKALTYLGGENYEIDKATEKSIKAHTDLFEKMPHDELFTLFTRLLLTRNISKVMKHYPTVFKAVSKELTGCVDFAEKCGIGCSLWEHISRGVEFSPPYPEMRYAMLFHNSGNPDCYSSNGERDYYYGHAERGRIYADMFFERVKADKKLRRSVDFLIEFHDTDIRDDRLYLKELLGNFSPDELKKLIKFTAADDMAKPAVHEGKIAEYRRALQTLDDILDSGECYLPSQLAINENDLMNRRLAKDRNQAGYIIDALFKAVLKQPQLNSAPVLLEYVQKSLKKQ